MQGLFPDNFRITDCASNFSASRSLNHKAVNCQTVQNVCFDDFSLMAKVEVGLVVDDNLLHVGNILTFSRRASCFSGILNGRKIPFHNFFLVALRKAAGINAASNDSFDLTRIFFSQNEDAPNESLVRIISIYPAAPFNVSIIIGAELKRCFSFSVSEDQIVVHKNNLLNFPARASFFLPKNKNKIKP